MSRPALSGQSLNVRGTGNAPPPCVPGGAADGGGWARVLAGSQGGRLAAGPAGKAGAAPPAHDVAEGGGGAAGAERHDPGTDGAGRVGGVRGPQRPAALMTTTTARGSERRVTQRPTTGSEEAMIDGSQAAWQARGGFRKSEQRPASHAAGRWRAARAGVTLSDDDRRFQF